MRDAPIDLVLVGYRTDDSREAIRFCDRSLASLRPGRKVFVYNRSGLAKELRPLLGGWELMKGSNDLGEFSGWQEGLDGLGLNRTPTAGVIFVNDTVTAHRHFTLARALAFKEAIRSASTASLCGFHDRLLDRKLSIDGLALEAWASTYCFFLSTEAIHRLHGRMYEPSAVVACAPGGSTEETFFDQMSPDLSDHLRRWLFDGIWYGGGRLSYENQARFELKARCITAELLLSARCKAMGVEAVDPFEQHPRLEAVDHWQRRIARKLRKVVQVD